MSRCLSVAAIAATVAIVGCSSDEPAKDQVDIEMSTWWVTGGEEQALASLERNNRLRHPNVGLVKNRQLTADEAFRRLDSSLALGQPPDTFQVNGGSMLMSRVLFERAGTKNDNLPPSRLEPLDQLYLGTGAQLWPFLDSPITANGKRYSVPLNVHRTNNLYFSVPKLMHALGLTELNALSDLGLPRDINGFMALVSRLAEAQEGGQPLAIGVQNLWTLENLILENLLASVAMSAGDLRFDPAFDDAEKRLGFYERFWQGESQLHPSAGFSHDVLDGTLRRAQQLWPYMLPIAAERNRDGMWQCAFDELLDSKSKVLMVIAGDWATGYLESRSAVYVDKFPFVPAANGETPWFGSVPFPGTEQLFIYTTDTLPLTVGATHHDATRGFLETALDLDVQLEFSEFKGSVPALRLDDTAIAAQAKVYKREILTSLQDESIRKSLAISGLVSPDMPAELIRTLLWDMLTAEDPVNARDNVRHAIESHYWTMTMWTDTLEQAQ